jgi:hypothetical protein
LDESAEAAPKCRLAKAPRPGLQVVPESASGARIGELDGDDERPGAMPDSHPCRTGVVPVEPSVRITREANVMAIGVREAAEDVDEAPLFHAGRKAGSAPEMRKTTG